MKYLFLFSLVTVLYSSCYKYKCSTPSTIMMALRNYDTTNGDTSAVVSVYAKNGTFSSLTYNDTVMVIYYNYSMQAQVNFSMDFGSDYIIRLLPSNKEYKVSQLGHGNYSQMTGPGGGEKENCVNSFSYVLNGKTYQQEQIGLGHSNMTSIPYYTISVD